MEVQELNTIPDDLDWDARQRTIWTVLMNTDGVTGKALSSVLGISPSTLSKIVRDMSDCIESRGLTIHSTGRHGSGYSIREVERTSEPEPAPLEPASKPRPRGAVFRYGGHLIDLWRVMDVSPVEEQGMVYVTYSTGDGAKTRIKTPTPTALALAIGNAKARIDGLRVFEMPKDVTGLDPSA